ncbi:P-loop containing nucleoside triphosphate hydrolase protein, partial [Trichoderma citrinoviride]
FERIQQYCNYADVDFKDESYYEPGHVDLRDESEVHLLAPGRPSELLEAPHDNTVSIHSQGLKWSRNGPLILKDLHLDISQETITAITGPVGSGKSSLLNSILGEMIDVSSPGGQQEVGRRYCKHVAYCSQQPWLENTTIRNNILSSSPYEKKWYDEVVTSCGLDADLKRLHRGDKTNIGSRGLNLSGGQKHRIALARAIYARKPIVLLDDVFSSMDAHTIDVISSRLLSRVGLLRRQRATVILITHHLKLMALADIVIVLKDGTITAKEPPASLIQSDLVNQLGLQLINNEDAAETAEPSKMPTTEEVFGMAADTATAISEETDGRHTDIRRKRGELSVYAYYLANAGWWSVIVYGVGVVGWIFCIEFSTVWMKWWSAANAAEPDKDIWIYLGVYASLGILGTLSGCICAWAAFISIISRSAARLHSNLLQATLMAPFYSKSTRDIGEVLNRFSRDMELIDMELPSNMVNYTSSKFTL